MGRAVQLGEMRNRNRLSGMNSGQGIDVARYDWGLIREGNWIPNGGIGRIWDVPSSLIYRTCFQYSAYFLYKIIG